MDCRSYTPLHAAIDIEHKGMVRLLLLKVTNNHFTVFVSRINQNIYYVKAVQWQIMGGHK